MCMICDRHKHHIYKENPEVRISEQYAKMTYFEMIKQYTNVYSNHSNV